MKPNILFIITHDTGDFLGCYKPGEVNSANLDDLAKKGLQFMNYFAVAPQCSPSRGSILTGKMPHSHGLMGLVNRGWNLPEENETLPKILKKTGYSTHLLGLQHEQQDPYALGYETVFNQTIWPTSDNVLPSVLQFLDAVERNEISQPFYANIGFFDTHRPYMYPDTASRPDIRDIKVPPYLPDDPKVRKDIAEFYGAIEYVDSIIGQIMEKLNQFSYARDTMVIFTVDHGWAMPKAKCTLYDQGIKTSLLIYYPQSPFKGGKKYQELLSNIDLLPTILEFLDLEIPEDIEGQSFLPLVLGEQYDERGEIFAELTYHDCYNAMRAVRTKRWKYIKNFAPLETQFEIPLGFSNTETTQKYIESYPNYQNSRVNEELYDLQSDPYELTNLAGDINYQKIKKMLEEKLHAWLQRTNDPILVGHIFAPIDSMDFES